MTDRLIDRLYRHVMQGQGHIDRQQGLVERLERAGAQEEASLAREVLRLYEDSQKLHEKHLSVVRRSGAGARHEWLGRASSSERP